MSALWRIARLVMGADTAAFGRGLALAALVLVMGALLLGVSGWFITAAAAAGLAGAGTVFNVFVPSAAVRFLALARTAARYGERLATHDATLRAVSGLRLRLLGGLMRQPYRNLERLRAAVALNRVTSDVDALDGVSLRLVLPALAGGLTLALASGALWLLVHPGVGLLVGLGYTLAPALVLLAGRRAAQRPARRAEAAIQALRSRMVDMVAAREDLVMYGQLDNTRAHVLEAAARHRTAQDMLDRTEQRMGLALDMTGWAVTAGVLGLGAALVQEGAATPATAAVGVFAALALREAIAPVRRAVAEIGRMDRAARRVAPSLDSETGSAEPVVSLPEGTGVLRAEAVTARRGKTGRPIFIPVSFVLRPGETVALTGPSGSGKTTVLLMAAGQIAPDAGRMSLGEQPACGLWPGGLTGRVAMVPQRPSLVAGTIAENLRLAAPDAPDDALWRALRSVCLDRTVAARGGLGLRLGFRGAGLSGGETRRLALARALLCRPDLLILDEPTEGLDPETSAAVLRGLRAALPRAAILIAAHRPAEIDSATRTVALQPPDGSGVK